MAEFIPGLRLSELYFRQVVADILRRHFPRLRYSAGLVGAGSETLGYDTPQSMDHNWGLRLMIFVSEQDIRKKDEIDDVLRRELPSEFLGHPTGFGKADEIGVRIPNSAKSKKGRVGHYVMFLTIGAFLRQYLGIVDYKHIRQTDWLTFPEQRLLEVTSGGIFQDDLRVRSIIQKFSYYPRDVWLHLMASQWQKIADEEAFVGRTGAIGDELGSKIIAARIGEGLMRLSFLMERRYAPYSKWFGTAFSKLKVAGELKPVLEEVLASNSLDEREEHLSEAYRIVAEKHNSLHITKPIPTSVSKFYDRPYLVIHAERFAAEIRKRIRGKEIRELHQD